MTSSFKNTTINDTGYIQIASGTTGERPATAATLATFTSTGTTTWTAPASVYNVEVLVVGGGGGGGGNNSGGQTPQGGGGGGGVIYQTFYPVTPATAYTVTVGGGGPGGTSGSNSGTSGTNSVFDTLTAVGGGSTSGGGGTSGGSGGGARNGSGGAGTTGQGFAGGNATGGANAAGGGGGAGGAGTPGGTVNGGFGGPGVDVNISGVIKSYGGGGGGGAYGGIPGQGGEGGGGAGGENSVNGVAGTANTGGGGGGTGSGAGGSGGGGGSGIVILRWVTSGAAPITGMSRHNSTLSEKETYTATGWTSNNIVKDSLTVWLDAADNRSYSGSGTTWTDLSGNGNNGTLTNGPVYTADRSFTFDGTNDHVTLTTSLWSANGEQTFSAWVYVNKLGLQMNMFECGGAGDFLVLEDGGIRFHPVSSNYNETSTIKLLEKQWYHVALVQGTNYRTLYVNSEPSGTIVGGGNPYTAAWANATGQMRLAHAGVARNYFNGRMAHVAIYNKALTPAQINQNYHATKARFVSVGDTNPYGTFKPNGLFIHYDFSNPACWPGYGPQVYDLVGTQNGIINGPKPGGVGMAKFFDFEKDIASHWIVMGSRIPYGQSTSELTMEAWIFTESLAGGDGIGGIISSQWDTYQNGASINTDTRSSHGGGPNGYHYQLGVNSVWSTQGSDGNSASGTAEFSGRWDHVVATRASGGIKYIYENGVSLGSEGTYAGTMDWANVFWNLGCQNMATGSIITSSGTQRFYDGKIAIARIYNRALDASDVLYNYNGQKNRFGL